MANYEVKINSLSIIAFRFIKQLHVFLWEMVFDIHIFVCTNQRTGTDRLSCGEAHGLDLVTEFKKQTKDLKTDLKIRAQRAGCLGICDFGPTVVIYPEGIFYVNVKKEDVTEIIQSLIVNKKLVERLVLKKQ